MKIWSIRQLPHVCSDSSLQDGQWALGFHRLYFLGLLQQFSIMAVEGGWHWVWEGVLLLSILHPLHFCNVQSKSSRSTCNWPNIAAISIYSDTPTASGYKRHTTLHRRKFELALAVVSFALTHAQQGTCCLASDDILHWYTSVLLSLLRGPCPWCTCFLEGATRDVGDWWKNTTKIKMCIAATI